MVDVGWGSDVTAVRQALPDVFLNLRLSPVRMLHAVPQEIAADTEALLAAAGPLANVGVCCINMDYGTPDENIFALMEVVRALPAAEAIQPQAASKETLMTTPWKRFKEAATLGEPEQVPVALIVDSPWLPGYAGINTLDYFLYPEKWLQINLDLLDAFPGCGLDSRFLGRVRHGRSAFRLWRASSFLSRYARLRSSL